MHNPGVDEETGKAVLRVVINATIGFEPLAPKLERPGKSLTGWQAHEAT
jgi:hypothetical protein